MSRFILSQALTPHPELFEVATTFTLSLSKGHLTPCGSIEFSGNRGACFDKLSTNRTTCFDKLSMNG